MTEQSGKYDYCPIFDNGAGLMSNLQVYSADIKPRRLIPTIKARSFNISFSRQMSNMRSLHGQQLRITKLTKSEIEAILAPLLEYYPKYLRGIIPDRVMCCIMTMQKLV